ncbi:hypothetical protein Patl1_19782 [Pistacia atlantica]|uniref:Uncharacterized protein n=1 Tax=Pistacia atlantica TaxID=434234 RepID=A0ACC1BJC4_9ROSI|nr:hypothetical protein Patl1_19782 [Pistacia atlantica]
MEGQDVADKTSGRHQEDYSLDPLLLSPPGYGCTQESSTNLDQGNMDSESNWRYSGLLRTLSRSRDCVFDFGPEPRGRSPSSFCMLGYSLKEGLAIIMWKGIPGWRVWIMWNGQSECKENGWLTYALVVPIWVRSVSSYGVLSKICRDPRWGRCYESYSKDHKVVQAMTEIILGLQGYIPSDSRKGLLYVGGKDKVAACTKHFVGDGGTTNGINENNTVIDLHELLSIHMPAYSDSIIKGVSTIMVSYSNWNGVNMHANHELVTGFLKNILKFKVSSPCFYRPHSNCTTKTWLHCLNVRVSGADKCTIPAELESDHHYVNNSKAVRESMCFMMDPRVGKRLTDLSLLTLVL